MFDALFLILIDRFSINFNCKTSNMFRDTIDIMSSNSKSNTTDKIVHMHLVYEKFQNLTTL